jgi:hypothetical protein
LSKAARVTTTTLIRAAVPVAPATVKRVIEGVATPWVLWSLPSSLDCHAAA